MTDYRPYVVVNGDYLTSIAARLGADAQDIWEHSTNEELRSLRSNANMLVAGDILYVPDTVEKWQSVPEGKETRLRVRMPRVRVTARFVDRGKPIANEPYVVEEVEAEPGKTDAAGGVHVMVPTAARRFRIFFPVRQEVFVVRVGYLDPANTPSGARSRLGSLGYYGRFGGVGPLEGPEEHLAPGLRRFQREHKLSITGELDAKTTATLIEVFGC